MKEITWLDDKRIRIEAPKSRKKITGTRFATILGLNPWSTPFEMWCAITKTYEKPFEDTIYTLAGKTIEPKQARYLEKSYGMNLIAPAKVYGKDYFNVTRGDFFPENKHLGGMWDYLGVDEDNQVDCVFEMKTTKRTEDWEDDIPEYYALQAALYAYLMGLDNVIMVASFLEEGDYKNPDGYIPNVSNTITIPFKLSERYPNFKELVDIVEKWYEEHVETGISPTYDEKKDAEILAALRTNTLSPDTDIEALIQEAESLKEELDLIAAEISPKEKRYKTLTELIKKQALSQFRDGDKKVEVIGNKFIWTVTHTTNSGVNKELMKDDGIWDKYQTTTDVYKMTVKEVK